MSTAATTPQHADTRWNARLDRIPFVGRHALWIVVLGLGYLVEMYDNTVFSYAAPSIRTEFGLSVENIGFITSVSFAGMFVGAVLGGRLADRFGRKKILIISCILYSLMSLLVAVSPNYEILFISRLLTGMALQANTGVMILYVAEMFPKLSRGRFFSVLQFVGASAGPLTSLAALTIAPTSVSAWRWLFVIGGSGIVITLLVAWLLPESVRWLTATGRTERAAKIVTRLETDALKRNSLLPEPDVEAVATPTVGLRELFKPLYLRRLIVSALAWFLYIFSAYGILSWVPTILTDRGMTQSAALAFASVVSFASMAGPVVLFSVADRIERKTAILVGASLGGVGLLVFAFASDVTVSMVACFGAQMFITVMAASFQLYLGEIFPTHVRGVGAGTANAMGRLGGVVSGVSIAAIYTTFGFASLYTALAIILLISGLLVFIFGSKTSRRALEDISPE